MAPPRKQEPPRASLPSPLPPAMDFTTGDNDDPLASILGPGSGTTLLGKADDEIPDEILAIFTEHGLHGKKFRVMLKQMDDSGSDDGNLPFVKSWTRSIPSLDFIAGLVETVKDAAAAASPIIGTGVNKVLIAGVAVAVIYLLGKQYMVRKFV